LYLMYKSNQYSMLSCNLKEKMRRDGSWYHSR
jgi:hypothetical protein